MGQTNNETPRKLAGAWKKHERRWKDHLYVYAVISRRSRGVSVGINLNPGKECNFDCVYCQVNRAIPPRTRKVDLDKLSEELDHILDAERDGSLYEDAPFDLLRGKERGLRDIAFSGDGEPTAYPKFEEAVRRTAQAKTKYGLDAAKMVLITDAAYLHKPSVRSALEILHQNNGEVWAKLDAGTEAGFRRINRPNVSLSRVLENISMTAQIHPIVIQSLWFRTGEDVPKTEEIEAYCARLNEILSAGGRIKYLQLYTIARDPSEPNLSPLSQNELDPIAEIVKSRVPVPIEIFY